MIKIKIEDLKSWKKLSCLIILLGGLFFIIITIIAMFFYPGGYSFFNDYFSTLGTSKSFKTYEPNPISSVLFMTACIVTGISLIPFWIVLTTLFQGKNIIKYLSYLGTIIGFITSPTLIGVGIFPGDIAPIEHFISAKTFFLSFATAILIYSIAILLNENYQKIFALIGFGFSFLIIIFVFGVFTGINPLMQKIIVYGFIIWAFLQIIKIWNSFDYNVQNHE